MKLYVYVVLDHKACQIIKIASNRIMAERMRLSYLNKIAKGKKVPPYVSVLRLRVEGANIDYIFSNGGAWLESYQG